MLGRVISLNYLDPSILVVDVHIDGIMVPNTLIDLGATINVMTRETMLLQLAYRSTISLEGVIEDVLVSIDSRENPTDFLSLQPKTKFNGYPLIL